MLCWTVDFKFSSLFSRALRILREAHAVLTGGPCFCSSLFTCELRVLVEAHAAVDRVSFLLLAWVLWSSALYMVLTCSLITPRGVADSSTIVGWRSGPGGGMSKRREKSQVGPARRATRAPDAVAREVVHLRRPTSRPAAGASPSPICPLGPSGQNLSQMATDATTLTPTKTTTTTTTAAAAAAARHLRINDPAPATSRRQGAPSGLVVVVVVVVVASSSSSSPS